MALYTIRQCVKHRIEDGLIELQGYFRYAPLPTSAAHWRPSQTAGSALPTAHQGLWMFRLNERPPLRARRPWSKAAAAALIPAAAERPLELAVLEPREGGHAVDLWQVGAKLEIGDKRELARFANAAAFPQCSADERGTPLRWWASDLVAQEGFTPSPRVAAPYHWLLIKRDGVCRLRAALSEDESVSYVCSVRAAATTTW